MEVYTFTAGASDPDVPANTLSFSLLGAPAGATIHPATGAFSWTPTEAQGPGEKGVDDQERPPVADTGRRPLQGGIGHFWQTGRTASGMSRRHAFHLDSSVSDCHRTCYLQNANHF